MGPGATVFTRMPVWQEVWGGLRSDMSDMSDGEE
jgi:hypothetical protein